MEFKYPEYYIVGARPVKVVRTEAGGTDCLAYNWETGQFERNLSYLPKVDFMEGEVDSVDEEMFNQQVEKLRSELTSANAIATPVTVINW